MDDHDKVINRVGRRSAGASSIPAEAQASVEEYLLRDRGVTALIGTVLAAVSTCVLLWHSVSRWRLVPWAVALVVSGAAMVAVVGGERFHRPVDRHGSPWSINLCAASAGLVLGSLVWVGSASLDVGTTRMMIVALLMAMSAGAVAGRAAVTGQGAWTFVPMAVVAVSGFVATGHGMLAVCLTAYAAFMIKNLHETSGMLLEVVLLRGQAKHDAAAAERAAGQDPLTGLLNRSALKAFDSDSTGHRTTAFFVDLDHFKAVNDRFGHAVGDELLVAVAERIRRVARREDVVARLGGDEFLVLSDSPDDEAAHDAVAQRIIDELGKPFSVREHEISISASVGVAVSADDAEVDVEDLQRQADHALYLAKREGRSQSVRFDDDLKSKVADEAELAAAISEALARKEFRAWGQPVIDVATGRPMAIELLARWHRPSGSVELPGDFLPSLRDQGLLAQLSLRMLDEMASLLDVLAVNPALSRLRVSLNVSARQLLDETFVGDLRTMIADGRIEPSRILIELTDSDAVWLADDVLHSLRRMAELGIGLIVDDFGQDRLSVSPLLELPITAVKLSGDFVAQVATGERPKRHLEALVGLCRTLGVTPVAKGVEHPEVHRELTACGVTWVQGYLYCKPLPLEDLGRWLRHDDSERSSSTRASTVDSSTSFSGAKRP
ncbi:MAG: EAL domain-containing protein [Acidimicrobiia bacterium]|nr:EAL domain-containing protein [Acidimicrobiia bacterium]